MLFPNSANILEDMGFDKGFSKSTVIRGFRAYSVDGEVKMDLPVDMSDLFGANCLAQKRGDFRSELMRLALEEDGNGNGEVEIKWNIKVVDVDSDKGVVTLETREIDQADVAISRSSFFHPST